MGQGIEVCRKVAVQRVKVADETEHAQVAAQGLQQPAVVVAPRAGFHGNRADHVMFACQHGRGLDSANPNPRLIKGLLHLSDALPELRIIVDHLPSAFPGSGQGIPWGRRGSNRCKWLSMIGPL